MGFKSGDYASQSRIWIPLSCMQSSSNFDVCCGSLSCWNTHRSGSSHSAYGNIFVLFVPESVNYSFDFMKNPEKQAQIITFPSPCFAVTLQNLGLSHWPLPRRPLSIPSELIELNLDSSLKSAVFHFLTIQLAYFLAKFILFIKQIIIIIFCDRSSTNGTCIKAKF